MTRVGFPGRALPLSLPNQLEGSIGSEGTNPAQVGSWWSGHLIHWKHGYFILLEEMTGFDVLR